MLAFLFALQSTAFALPQQLTQQGRLLDSSGSAVTGGHDLHFKLYDDAFSGSLLWEETLSVNFNNGFYAVILGGDIQNNPLDETILSQAPIYLELAIPFYLFSNKHHLEVFCQKPVLQYI